MTDRASEDDWCVVTRCRCGFAWVSKQTLDAKPNDECLGCGHEGDREYNTERRVRAVQLG